MRRPWFALHASLCAAGCTGLAGRVASDASTPDVVDASSPTDVARTADAAPRDVASCPLGARARFDPRVEVTLDDTGPGTPLGGPAYRVAFVDREGRIFLAGSCFTCVPGASIAATVWRLDPNGRLDTDFGEGGVRRDTDASTWFGGAADTEGRAWVVGFRAGGGVAVARVDAQGRRDEAFNATARRSVDGARLGPGERFGFGVALDEGGALVVGGNVITSHGPSTEAFALRLGQDGALDADFADGRALPLERLHGCFDVAREGAGWVLACVSESDRPAMLRLDATGRTVPWAGGAEVSVHPSTPRGFQVRALRRDSAGRWIVTGAISRIYDDTAAPPAAVRFGADGTPDMSYGVGGLAAPIGARHSFAYSFASSAHVGCDDRLLLGAAVGGMAGVIAFDRDGRLMSELGDDGELTTPARGTFSAATFGVLPGVAPGAVTILSMYATSSSAMMRRLLQ